MSAQATERTQRGFPYTPPMPIDQRPLAVFVMGPTASGKTALACALARHFRGRQGLDVLVRHVEMEKPTQ